MVLEGLEKEVKERPCDEVLSDPHRGKLLLDFRAVVKHPLKFLRSLGPFLTAHHPLCSHFDGHTTTIRNRKYCIGCLFNSLFFFSSLIIYLLVWFLTFESSLRHLLFWSGIVGTALSLLFSALGLTDNMKIKIVAKFFLGSGFAAICTSILLIGDDLFVQIDVKTILILMLYFPVMTILNGKRMWEIEKECKECEYKMRWSKCPGFKDIVCRNVEEGFIKPEEKQPKT